MLLGILWTKKLKLHARIQLFTSTLNLSHTANNSVHIGFHKPNLIYKPKTKEEKNNKPKPSAYHLFKPLVWTLPVFFLAFEHLCHSPSQLLHGYLELIPNVMQMSKRESNLPHVAFSPMFWYNVTLVMFRSISEWLLYTMYHGLPLWFVFVSTFPKD